MKILIITAILLTSVLTGAAQNKTFFQKIAGNWEGSLEYLDYQENKRVKLKTYLTVTPAADGNSAEFQTVYDDVTNIIKEKETVKIDSAANKYIDGDFFYQIESLTDEKIVLLGSGQDGKELQPFRKTITYNENSLSFLKETRSPWQFRNETVLKRTSENILAKKILTVEQMRADFIILQKTLTAIHPGIYRYQTPASLTKVFSEFTAKLKTPLPEEAFFVLVSQLTSRLDCGHTYQTPYNQNVILRDRLFNTKTYLPFYFKIIAGKIIVTENASAINLPRGSEIKTIDGIPAKTILQKLLTVTKADGRNNTGHRLSSIELDRFEAERYALFDLYFPLFFPLKGAALTIEVIDFQTKKLVSFQTAPLTKDERTTEMAKRYGKSPTYDDGWKFNIGTDGIARLKIDNSITWRLKKIKFKEFLAMAFAEIRAKNVKNLIIDLRGNDGGDMDVGFELSKYLAQKELPIYAASHRLARNVVAQPELAEYLETNNDGLKTALQKGTPKESYNSFENGFFEVLPNETTDNYPKVVPYDNNFRGQAFIIADGSNASATFQFLDYVKENKLAKIAGQASGGNRQGINGGNYFFLRLPNSKIETDIPAYFQAPLKQQKDESIIPDMYVKPNAADIGNGIDTELDYLKRTINEN